MKHLNELPLPIITVGQLSTDQNGEDCDACVVAYNNYEKINPISEISSTYYRIPEDSYWIPLDNKNYIIHSAFIKNSIALINNSAFLLWKSFKQPSSLKEQSIKWTHLLDCQIVANAFQEMIDVGLLIQENQNSWGLTSQPSILSGWLHVTDRCNLRCNYCYLPHQKIDMPLEIGIKVIDLLFRQAKINNYSGVKLKFAGGEPLLKFSVISNLYNYALKLSQQTALNLSGTIVTNGTLLTPDIAMFIKKLNLKLVISLDGLEIAHNIQRPYSNGKGSFIDIKKAIELSIACGIKPHVSITLSNQNIRFISECIEWLLEIDIPFSINFYRANKFSSSSDLAINSDEFIAELKKAYKVIEGKLPRHTLLAGLLDRTNLSIPHFKTCGVENSYLVFSPDGKISKCHMTSDDPVSNLQDDDALNTIRYSLRGVRNLPVQEKDECVNCHWRNWCTGGCPLMSNLAYGNFASKSPNCDIYKALCPEVIKLEGLRILKQFT